MEKSISKTMTMQYSQNIKRITYSHYLCHHNSSETLLLNGYIESKGNVKWIKN